MPTEKTLEDRQKEAEQMQNVLLLLNHLIENEETTVKLIIDCLYEVGSVNLINHKITGTQKNNIARAIAGMSKPAAKIFAFRWFKKNCPDLIVKWLQSKVAFKPVVKKQANVDPPEVASQESPKQLSVSPITAVPDAQLHEIKQLRGQVKILTGLLLCSMTALCGTAVWQMYQVSQQPSPPEQPLVRPVLTSPEAQTLR